MPNPRKARKVDNKPVVKGKGLFEYRIRKVGELPGIRLLEFNNVDPGWKFEFGCMNEEVARSLAKLMRDLKL